MCNCTVLIHDLENTLIASELKARLKAMEEEEDSGEELQENSGRRKRSSEESESEVVENA